jgi:formylglycine-generating enzyme required for sulfatase activity
MPHDSIGDDQTLQPVASRLQANSAIGTLIGSRYQVARLLGRGGMGEVYACFDTRLDRDVAVKRLLSDQDMTPVALERFRREAKAIAKLAHPNIVTLYDYDSDALGPYLVMELLSGTDLQQQVRTNGPLSPTALRPILDQVVRALSYAHSCGVVHRDIKPSNLRLLSDSTVKVLDFGLARHAQDATMTMSGAALGTLDFLAPEQQEDGSKADARSDQYSLGATAYFLLTGKRPRAIREKDVPDAWRELVFKSMEESPADRYTSMDALAEALAAIGAPSSRVAAPSSIPSHASSAPAPNTTPRRHQVQEWADVLVEAPDPKIVTDPATRERLSATGFPWRVMDRTTGIEMVLIPSGEYMRGASPGDSEAFNDELPAHEVVITKSFYLGVYEVTQGEWERLMGSNPSHFKGARLPVESVSWNDTQEFLGKSKGLRLPTEGEWEYACRAGTTGSRYGDLDQVAWYRRNSGNTTHAIGGKQPNGFGLHDMLGNVWEWCSDCYGAYPGGSQVDPSGPSSGQFRVCRGGSWFDCDRFCRASPRLYCGPAARNHSLGIRVARTP